MCFRSIEITTECMPKSSQRTQIMGIRDLGQVHQQDVHWLEHISCKMDVLFRKLSALQG